MPKALHVAEGIEWYNTKNKNIRNLMFLFVNST